MPDNYTKILAKDSVDPGFKGLVGFYMRSPSARAAHIMRCLTDLDLVRLQHMDEAGIDQPVIALTSPGVQVMDWATAVSFSILVNDTATVKSHRYDSMKPIRKNPSDYLREIYIITNSGVAWKKVIKFKQDVVGVDRVMYAMDYPYQYAVDEVAAMDNMQMSDADKMKFFQTNAQRVFKIKF